MENMISHIINAMLAKGIIEDKQRAVIAYGLDLLLSTVISLTILVWRGISLSDAPSVLDSDGLRSFDGLVCAAEAACNAAVLGRGNQRVPDSSHRACPECKSAFQ